MKQKLIDAAGKMGIEISDAAADKFILYMNLLISWNNMVNLTAITEPDKVISLHFLDSLTPVGEGLIEHGASVIDVGCGAGFPGLPIKLARDDVKLTLLDSLAKRLKFTEEVISQTGIQNVRSVHSRAEDGGRDTTLREKYDVAVSRAVANMAVLCEYCLPYVKVGGRFIALKGPAAQEELNCRAIEALGGRLLKIIDVKIPYEDLNHKIVVIEKVKPCPAQYPRKAGTPSKKPLV